MGGQDTPRAEELEKFKADRLRKGTAPATVNRTLTLLKTIYSKAEAWEKVATNPVKRVALLRENNQRIRFLEVKELGRLLDACQESRNQYLYLPSPDYRRDRSAGV